MHDEMRLMGRFLTEAAQRSAGGVVEIWHGTRRGTKAPSVRCDAWHVKTLGVGGEEYVASGDSLVVTLIKAVHFLAMPETLARTLTACAMLVFV